MLERTWGLKEDQFPDKPVRTYALFMGKDPPSGPDVVMYARIAVAVDRCEKRAFEAFDPSKYLPKCPLTHQSRNQSRGILESRSVGA